MRQSETGSDRRPPRFQFMLKDLFGLVWTGALVLSTLAILPQFFGSAEHGWRVLAACFAIWALVAVTYLRRPLAVVLAIHGGLPATAAALLAVLLVAGGNQDRGVAILAESCLVATLLSGPVFLVQILGSTRGRNHPD